MSTTVRAGYAELRTDTHTYRKATCCHNLAHSGSIFFSLLSPRTSTESVPYFCVAVMFYACAISLNDKTSNKDTHKHIPHC